MASCVVCFACCSLCIVRGVLVLVPQLPIPCQIDAICSIRNEQRGGWGRTSLHMASAALLFRWRVLQSYHRRLESPLEEVVPSCSQTVRFCCLRCCSATRLDLHLLQHFRCRASPPTGAHLEFQQPRLLELLASGLQFHAWSILICVCVMLAQTW